MPIPLAVPIILGALSSGLGAVNSARQANAQNALQRQGLGMTQQQIDQARAQQLRGNRMEDAQNAALNPVRSNLLSALAQRLGLPAGAVAFGAAARGPMSSPPSMPSAMGADRDLAAAESERDRSAFDALMRQADARARAPGITRLNQTQAAALRQVAAQRFPQFAGGR